MVGGGWGPAAAASGARLSPSTAMCGDLLVLLLLLLLPRGACHLGLPGGRGLGLGVGVEEQRVWGPRRCAVWVGVVVAGR